MQKTFNSFAMRLAPIFLMVFGAAQIHAQNAGTVRGSVTDPSASLVPGANIQLVGGGTTRSAKSDGQGKFTFTVPPGTYSVRADAKGFTTFTSQNLNITAGQVTPLDIALQVATESVQVQVQDEAAGAVTTDPSQNVGALVLKADDLEFLPDDPDDLQSDLQALAGPAAGPNGAQFFVDGFSGGQLPPKSSIREIRINSNPFSSEFDRPGFGRIEILTKPGTDKFHGGGFVNIGDKLFDSRNPFLTTDPPHYSSQMFSFNIGGPLSKKASFFTDFNNRDNSEQSLVNATGVDLSSSSLNIVKYNQAFPVPAKNFGLSQRLDYQLNATNTLVGRYNFNHSTNVGGVSGFSLPSQVSNSTGNNQNVQITETSILGTKAVDETRVQISRRTQDQVGSGLLGPTINVQSSFTDGGSPLLSNYTHTNDLEVHNILTTTQGRHTLKAGLRARYDALASNSTSNYNGTYTFTTPNSVTAGSAACLAGIANPTSLDVYRQTQILLKNGSSMASILAQGCGPTQFTLNSGIPLASVNQFDMGVFIQDDFRLRPNLTVSGGIRYEWQTNIGDHRSIAPRAAIAWAPGSKGGKPGKTVIRTGYGIFYDRFSDNNYLQTIRYNGSSQLNYNINSTQNLATAALALAAYPGLPSTAQLSLQNQPVYKVDPTFVAPAMLQFAVSMDRSLPGRTSVSVNFVDTRGVHDQRTRSINAYLPGTYDGKTGVRPFAGGDIYNYESTGNYNQRQIIVNANSRFNKHFSMQGYYSYGRVNSNVSGFPSNQYNTSLDWGRAVYDIRHRANFGGNVGLPLKMTLAPLVTISSAPPFNITTGTDSNGDGIINDRPSFASPAEIQALQADPKANSNIKATPWGTFNRIPLPGETIIPINYGTGFSHFTANLRLSRTFGWGERAGSAPNPGAGGGDGGPGGGGPGGPGGGGRGGGGPRGGGGGGFAGGGGRGGFGGFGGGNTGKKYNLTMTLSARNALNHVNYASPTGSLNSPTFGQSLSSDNGGGGRGGGGSSGNRKVELQLRFQF